MPRDHGRILSRIWRDPDFRQRTPEAQRLYVLLLSQTNVDNAGILPMQVSKWARGCVHTTSSDIEKALDELTEHRYVFCDEDTEEALIRSYMRNDGVMNHPNTAKNALRCAQAVESPALRVILAAELRRLRRRDANEVANELDPRPDPVRTPSTSHRDHVDTPSESHPDPESDPDGIAILAGQGQGQGQGESLVPEVVAAAARAHDEPQQQPEPPPNPIAGLKAALRTAGLTASWAKLRRDELAEITALIDAHGQAALVQAARAQHWPNNPAKSARAWLPAWRDLVTGSAPPTRPDWCGECDETTRQRADPEGRPFRCPDCHPLREDNPDA